MMKDGKVRTYFIFSELPEHIEVCAQEMPLVQEGFSVHFDELKISSHVQLNKRYVIRGNYKVERTRIIYSTTNPSRSGLTQYLEFIEVV